MEKISSIVLAFIMLFSTIAAQNSDHLNPFSGLGRNSINSLTGWNLLYHTAAITCTWAIIYSGSDTKIHNRFAAASYSSAFDPAVAIGYLMPVIAGGGLYLTGEMGNSPEVTAAASAVLQASLISVIYSSFLKAITGRTNPGPGVHTGEEESRTFRFGFMRNGIHYGWPSGHLCTNTAMTAALINFYPDKVLLKIAGCLYLGYLFYGVIIHENNTMHWFSDAVAGLLMGYAIGSETGRGFRDMLNSRGKDTPDSARQHDHSVHFAPAGSLYAPDGNYSFKAVPVITPGYQGLNLIISF